MMKTFKKVKLKDEQNFHCDYTEIIELPDNRTVENSDSKSIKAQLHPDLIAAFKKLRIHYALISNEIDDSTITRDMFNNLDAYDHKDLKQFVCNQVIISGYGEDRGIQLAGRKIVKQNKVINWTTPAIRPSHEEDYYLFKVDLHNDVENVLDEAEACLNGKYLEVTQMEIEETISMNEDGAN